MLERMRPCRLLTARGACAAGLLAVFLLLLPAAPARAAVGRWNRFGPAAGEVHAVIADPFVPGVLYATVGDGDLYRSLDNGASWGWSAAGIPREARVSGLAADPRQPGTLYAAGPFQVFRSDDRGARWTRVSGEGFQPFPPGAPAAAAVHLVAAPGRSTVLYLAGGDAVWRSLDGGRTWSRVLQAGTVRYLAADAGGTVYAGLQGGGVRRSDNAGRSWQPLGGLPFGAPIERLAFAFSRPRTLYAVAQSDVFRSDDRGATWRLVLAGSAHGDAEIVAVDPATPRIVYVTNNFFFLSSPLGPFASVRASEDGGATWRESRSHLVRGAILHLVAGPGRTVHAVSRFGMAASADFGRTWGPSLISAGEAAPVVDPAPGDRLRFDPRHPGRVYAVASATMFASSDGGRTWRVPGDSLVARIGDVVFDPVRPAFLYAASANGLLRSGNGGGTWDLVSAVPGPLATLAWAGPRTLVAGSAGLARSTDRGLTWATVVEPGALGRSRVFDRIAVAPADPSRLFATAYLVAPDSREIAGREVWRSADGGQSWTEIPGLRAVTLDPVRAGAAYAVSEEGEILHSTDGGEGWRRAGAVSAPGVDALLVDPAAPEDFYAALPAIGAPGPDVRRSQDAGFTWTSVRGGLRGTAGQPPLDLWADPAVPHRILLAAGGAFFEASFP